MYNKDYIKNSLELHLFFARIMKEHSFFLEAGFLDKEKEYKKIANDFQKDFSNILSKVVELSDGNISEEILKSKEIVTENTRKAERQSSNLTGLKIDESITINEYNLRSGSKHNERLMNVVKKINRTTLPLIENLIYFKKDILTQVLECKMFTANYPLLIEHIMNEAQMYHKLLTKIEKGEKITNQYIIEQELFWNEIMEEHAEFIRGLLDPSEDQLIATSNKFAIDYKRILSNRKVPLVDLTQVSLNKTKEFSKFKQAGEDGILSCKIKSIIIPLLTDHVLREANHFIRLLKSFSRN